MLHLRDFVGAALWTSLIPLARSAVVALEPRATTIPAPISFTPDQSWDGIDGQWNSFTLRVGSPTSFVRVLPATSSQQTWVVDVAACINSSFSGADTDKCKNSRGNVFNATASTSFDQIGYYGLWIESNLGYSGYANYGYDVVGLGYDGEGGPTIKNVTIGSLAVTDFWLGIFGLHPKPTNFSTFDEPSPSFMTLLKEQGHIPSISYAYTAGAQYRFTKVLASLTLGGYDTTRFIPNNISYTFAPDNERDLVVWLHTVSTTDSGNQEVALLTESIDMFIDSTVPQIWLPVNVCDRFEKAFGLIYDQDTDLYLVNSTQHDILKAQNVNVTFSIGPSQAGGPTVDIVLPYSAFDQVASRSYRGLQNSTNYFPLRRAHNDTQYVLGRTFLQEAYLIVDYERSNFSVHSINWQQDMSANIVPIMLPGSEILNNTTGTGKPSGSGLGTGAIIGIAVGIAGAAVVGAIVGFCLWRRNRRQKEAAERAARLAEEVAAVKDAHSEKSADGAIQQPPTSPTGGNSDGTTVFPKAELPANDSPRHEMPTGDEEEIKIRGLGVPGSPGAPGTEAVSPLFDPVEADNNERPIFEMEGDTPARSEADGRMLSEKESMLIREQRYNGTDPGPMPSPNTPTESGLTPTTPTSGDGQLRPPARRINPADVAMIPGTTTRLSLSPASAHSNTRGWEGPVSPLTPRGPVTLEETILSPLSPMPTEGSEGSRTLGGSSGANPDRRRFSYELDD